MDFSKLEQYAPEASFLKGYGATKFTCVDDTTICKDENNGESCVISVNFDSIMDQPELAVGDALIMRGDCIHRTQDVLSERTAISIRRVLSSTLITKEQHTNLTGTNKMIRKNNPELTGALNQLFSIKDTWSMGEMLKHLNNR
jgi:orotate phosphoribosyltransferase-like protein